MSGLSADRRIGKILDQVPRCAHQCCVSGMKSKLWKQLGIGLLASVVTFGTFAVWAYFAQRSLDARAIEEQAKLQELLDRRYPVKAGKPKARVAPAPLPAQDATPAAERPDGIKEKG